MPKPGGLNRPRPAGGGMRAERKKKLGKKKKKTKAEKKEAKKGWGGFLRFAGLAGGILGAWVANALKISKQRADAKGADRMVLAAMARKPLAITDHAACRMGCRFIGQDEITSSLSSGRINRRKSDPGLRPCPKYVVDAKVGQSSKNVQCVFAACAAETRVITVIDRDTNWACHCD